MKNFFKSAGKKPQVIEPTNIFTAKLYDEDGYALCGEPSPHYANAFCTQDKGHQALDKDGNNLHVNFDTMGQWSTPVK